MKCFNCSISILIRKWCFPFAPSLNQDIALFMEIMKQWTPQNNFYKQHDHATVLSILTYFDFKSILSKIFL